MSCSVGWLAGLEDDGNDAAHVLSYPSRGQIRWANPRYIRPTDIHRKNKSSSSQSNPNRGDRRPRGDTEWSCKSRRGPVIA